MSPFARSLVLLLLLPAACGPSASASRSPEPPKSVLPDDQGAAMTLEMAKISMASLQDYVDALMLCGSTVPADWAEARRRLNNLYPFHVFKEDPGLILEFGQGGEGARKELARRGRILRALMTFGGPYDKARWDEARRELLAAGEAGRVMLTNTLLQRLLDNQYRDRWDHLRYQLVEAGRDALETTQALARALTEEVPADAPLFRHEDLVQLFAVVIGFGDLGRPFFREMAGHAKPNVRRSAAVAIGETRDDAAAPELVRLLSNDPSWPVRAAAAEAAKRMGPARRIVGPALVDRAGKEREGLVLQRILRAIADVGWADGVPTLVAALEAPNMTTAETAMQALYVLTGERHTRREAWLQWYRTQYPAWRARQR